ncbi:MAG: hypothetical protein CSA86_04800 [Arcobacter sp.]|nr:MAG: hypothetical protein CSA86_04800 [Arcobacter sp.]
MKRNTPKNIRRYAKHQKKKSFRTSFLILSVILLSVLLGLIVGSFYGTKIDKVTEDIKTLVKNNDIQSDKNNIVPKEITFEEKTRALEIEYVDNTIENQNLPKQEQKQNKIFHFEESNLKEMDKKEIAKEINKKEEYKAVSPSIIKVNKTLVRNKKSQRPKLAIIIDDMTTQRQINSTKNLGYIVNMSFLPPTKGHTKSAKITQKLDNYMIHLPLQASGVHSEEENTLHINDSLKTIEERIKYLQKIYPGTRYINNHTGSTFTSNKEAMDKLFQVLKKYNYTFIDSRTTAKSLAKELSKKYGVKMYSRNIFLDNKKDKYYIQQQLKKAIKIAKKHGMAIAIGHPYRVTFQTLKESKDLLKDLDLVFVQDL